MLVDFALVGVNGARLDLLERHWAARAIRLEQSIDQRNSCPGYLPRDLGLKPVTNTLPEFVVLERQQFAIRARKIELVVRDPLAAEQRCR